MLAYDWMWWGQLTNQNLAWRCVEMHGGVRGGVQRGARRCTEVCGSARRGVQRCAEVHRGVHGGARRCAEGCAEVHGGAWRGTWRCTEGCGGCMEVFQRGGGEKNQDFISIRFLNAGIWLDVVGTINHGGAQRCVEGCVEGCHSN